jgi:hypothetical protein
MNLLPALLMVVMLSSPALADMDCMVYDRKPPAQATRF